MTTEALKNIKPLPGFDCLKMKRDIQAKMRLETAGMSWDQYVAYLQCRETKNSKPGNSKCVSTNRNHGTHGCGELRIKN